MLLRTLAISAIGLAAVTAAVVSCEPPKACAITVIAPRVSVPTFRAPTPSFRAPAAPSYRPSPAPTYRSTPTPSRPVEVHNPVAPWNIPLGVMLGITAAHSVASGGQQAQAKPKC